MMTFPTSSSATTKTHTMEAFNFSDMIEDDLSHIIDDMLEDEKEESNSTKGSACGKRRTKNVIE